MDFTRPGATESPVVGDAHSLRSRVQELASLPQLPKQARLILVELADPDLELPHLIHRLEQMPQLAARLMGIARSAFFAGPPPARDLADAVIRMLGLDLVRDLTICFLLSSPFHVNRCPAFEPIRYWRRAMLTATLADTLAPMVPGDETDALAGAYLGGLLHNLGLLALVHLEPDLMGRVFTAAAQEPVTSLNEVERSLLGMDHGLAGRHLAEGWNLPMDVAMVMEHHGNENYRGDFYRLVVLVRIAERFSAHVERTAGETAETDAVDPEVNRLGIAAGEWRHATAAWQTRVEEILELARLFC